VEAVSPVCTAVPNEDVAGLDTGRRRGGRGCGQQRGRGGTARGGAGPAVMARRVIDDVGPPRREGRPGRELCAVTAASISLTLRIEAEVTATLNAGAAVSMKLK